MQTSVREEVHVVREVLEGALPPEVATAAMFAALSRWEGGVPSSRQDVLDLCHGPLKEILLRRVGDLVTDELLNRLDRVLVHGDRTGTDIPLDIDIELDGEPSITITMPIVWREPVSVLIISGRSTFSARLEASLGAARLHTTLATSVHEIRRATFSEAPLLALVDCVSPPDVSEAELASALKDLPDQVLVVIWGEDEPCGEALAPHLLACNVESVTLARSEGIGPLLDLILSRYKEE